MAVQIMKEIKRDDVYIVTQNSDVKEETIQIILEERIYSNKQEWQKFIKLLLLTLGAGFCVAGIIFFFAYNWADLNKFIKLGMVQVLIVALAIIAVQSHLSKNLKNITLTAASVLVGVLFAVFGQIYQTGANAYDFFLGWTMFITIWVVVSNFAPLWLIYIALTNTTLILYANQVAHHWSGVYLLTLLFAINAIALVATKFASRDPQNVVPNWFMQVLALSVASYATIGIIAGIFGSFSYSLYALLLGTTALFWLGIKDAFRSKTLFYIALISLSTICILSALLIKISDDSTTFLFLTLFIPTSVTFTITELIKLKKKMGQ
jgi:uncharacterized membrane protein